MSLAQILSKQQYEDDVHHNLRVKLIVYILKHKNITPEDSNSIAMSLLNSVYYDSVPTKNMDKLITAILSTSN